MILNLTQHDATEEQLKAGVVEPTKEDKAWVRQLLTFNEIPSKNDIVRRAKELSEVAEEYIECEKAMIGGAPFLMPSLEYYLKKKGVVPVYSFSKIIVEDRDGVKISKFKFEGFVSSF